MRKIDRSKGKSPWVRGNKTEYKYSAEFQRWRAAVKAGKSGIPEAIEHQKLCQRIHGDMPKPMRAVVPIAPASTPNFEHYNKRNRLDAEQPRYVGKVRQTADGKLAF